MNPEILTADEVAAMLKVTKQALYQMTMLGPSAIPFFKIGRKLRFEKEKVLEHFMKANSDSK